MSQTQSKRVDYAPIAPSHHSSSHSSSHHSSSHSSSHHAPPPTPAATPVVYQCTVNGQAVSSHVFVPGAAASLNKDTMLEHVHNHARDEASAGKEAVVVCSHVRPLADNTSVPSAADEENHYLAKRMAPSCKKYSWDLSQVTTFNHYTCRYLGSGVVKDAAGQSQRVTGNMFKEYRGILPSCDTYGTGSHGLEITDETMRAVKRRAYEQAGGDEAQLDVDRFQCEVMSLPPY